MKGRERSLWNPMEHTELAAPHTLRGEHSAFALDVTSTSSKEMEYLGLEGTFKDHLGTE